MSSTSVSVFAVVLSLLSSEAVVVSVAVSVVGLLVTTETGIEAFLLLYKTKFCGSPFKSCPKKPIVNELFGAITEL